MRKGIKKPKITKSNPIMSRVGGLNDENKESEKIVFSFKLLDSSNEYFGLDGTCTNWSELLFSRLQMISDLKLSELYSGQYNSTLRVHKLDTKKSNFSPPNGIEEEAFVQIRLEKGKGGIHGIFIENTFYIVWFDPHHNMYDSDGYGGIIKIKPPETCCKYRDSELIKLKKENEELTDMLEVYTKPDKN